MHRYQLPCKFLAKRRQFSSAKSVLVVYRQERKDARALEVRWDINWSGDDMEVDVVKPFALRETHEVFFLD